MTLGAEIIYAIDYQFDPCKNTTVTVLKSKDRFYLSAALFRVKSTFHQIACSTCNLFFRDVYPLFHSAIMILLEFFLLKKVILDWSVYLILKLYRVYKY